MTSNDSPVGNSSSGIVRQIFPKKAKGKYRNRDLAHCSVHPVIVVLVRVSFDRVKVDGSQV